MGSSPSSQDSPFPWRCGWSCLLIQSRTRKPVNYHMCVLNRLSHGRLFVTLWTVARQAPLSLGFSRQEYWSGLPPPPPGDFQDPGIESKSLMSPALAGGFFGWINNKVLSVEHRELYSISYDKLEAEKAMAPHSSSLAWKIPWVEEPGRLQSMGSLGVGHD